jgi:EF hand
MMKASNLIIAGTAAVLLPVAAAFAQQGPTSSPATQPAEPSSQTAPAQQGGGATFESLDTNGDGKISKIEAEANAGVKAQFSRYDVNGDGFIERDEVNAANKPPAETPQQ